MAITVSLLGTPTFNTTSGSKSVTATPAVGDLIVIITAHSGNTSTAAPTDNQTGGTYTLVNTAVKATSADTMKVWVRDALITSATSTIFTHNPATSTGGGLVVVSCQGMDKAGASAIVRSAIQSNIASGTPAPVLGAVPSLANAIIGAVFNGANPAAMTQRTGYTELYDSGYNTPATGLEVISDNSGETSATITWGSSSATAFASVAVELNSLLTHATTGTLIGQIGSVTGSSVHNALHPTSGTPTGQGSTVTGNATSFTTFSTSGGLIGQSSVIAGSAKRFRAYATSGILAGQVATINGSADRQAPHTASGSLNAGNAIVIGSASRYRQYFSSAFITANITVTANGFPIGYSWTPVAINTNIWSQNSVSANTWSDVSVNTNYWIQYNLPLYVEDGYWVLGYVYEATNHNPIVNTWNTVPTSSNNWLRQG